MKRLLMILALLSMLISIGCTAALSDLADTHWELVFYGPGSNLAEVIDGTRVTLNFSAKADSIGGSAGCNSYGGDVDIDGKN